MTRQLVVIACGAAKLDRPAPAADLYVGSYFRLAKAAALQLADRHSVRVLSAKHGLLRLDDVVAPYDLTLGQPGAIDPDRLRWQVLQRGLWSRPVAALCPGRYARLLAAVFRDVDQPLAGLGIGCQCQVLARLRDGA